MAGLSVDNHPVMVKNEKQKYVKVFMLIARWTRSRNYFELFYKNIDFFEFLVFSHSQFPLVLFDICLRFTFFFHQEHEEGYKKMIMLIFLLSFFINSIFRQQIWTFRAGSKQGIQNLNIFWLIERKLIKQQKELSLSNLSSFAGYSHSGKFKGSAQIENFNLEHKFQPFQNPRQTVPTPKLLCLCLPSC